MKATINTSVANVPWNKGKLTGQKSTLKLKEIWAIRIRLQLGGKTRDLAMFNLAIDSKLRACDLAKMRVRDVCMGTLVAPRATVMQQKTQRPVQGVAQILKRSHGVDAVVEHGAAPIVQPRRVSWRNYGVLFDATYRKRTILATVIDSASSFGYNAIIFGLPVIITSFFAQDPLTTIVASLALDLLFAFVGGLIGVRTAPTVGAWKMTVLGHSLQFVSLIGLALIGRPGSGAFVAILLLGGYLFGQGFGPGSHSMTYASLSYPTSLRGVGVGFNQTLVRLASTISLFLFPVLAGALGTKVFWVIAIAPLVSLLVLLAIRWEPSGYDIDDEDYQASQSLAH